MCPMPHLSNRRKNNSLNIGGTERQDVDNLFSAKYRLFWLAGLDSLLTDMRHY